MTNDKGILIKNIYYMLTYTFQVLKQENYKKIAAEEFDHIQNLFAAILALGISHQLKQGLYREYITKTDDLSTLRGKIKMQGSIRNRLQRKTLLNCEYDELSENHIFHQILKTTTMKLLKDPCVEQEWKSMLKKEMVFFADVDEIALQSIRWEQLQFRRNNRTYEMLVNVCYFIISGLLQTTEEGSNQMHSFLDKRMAELFEKFVLEYYKRHLPELRPSASIIHWDLDEGEVQEGTSFLPEMKTDVVLQDQTKLLVIDAKYYKKTMQEQYSKKTLHSKNLYQIYAYVKNQAAVSKKQVSGLLLYAKTEESILPDGEYSMGGNRINVKTLDLNVDFKDLSKQLNHIAEQFFGEFDKVVV